MVVLTVAFFEIMEHDTQIDGLTLNNAWYLFLRELINFMKYLIFFNEGKRYDFKGELP